MMANNKIALILPANTWVSPYLSIYMRELSAQSIAYDIISWNRDGTDGDVGIQYNVQCGDCHRIKKFMAYMGFVRFVKHVLDKNKYDKLVIFTAQLSILLYPFIRIKYNKKYIVDYRDFSIEQHPFFRLLFRNVVRQSYANVVSSVGYIPYLPNCTSYILCHNMNVEDVDKALANNTPSIHSHSLIRVLTIGGIRNAQANIEIINSFANDKSFHMDFVGKGPALPRLKEYAMVEHVDNISFVGFYKKEMEASFVRDCSIMNIYFPNTPSHTAIMSNRFYNALIYRKPMIVLADSIQGKYVEDNNLGVAVRDCTHLSDKVKMWLAQVDSKDFDQKCNQLLMQFRQDHDIFVNVLMQFCHNN